MSHPDLKGRMSSSGAASKGDCPKGKSVEFMKGKGKPEAYVGKGANETPKGEGKTKGNDQ